jgi:hypothetical protein
MTYCRPLPNHLTAPPAPDQAFMLRRGADVLACILGSGQYLGDGP